jgi:CheY-like chemotaxis protein
VPEWERQGFPVHYFLTLYRTITGTVAYSICCIAFLVPGEITYEFLSSSPSVDLYDMAPASSLPRRKRASLSHSILIVDDNNLVRRLLRSWLEQNSEWEICGEAENGKIAVESVKQLHPDIVILDLQMPVMNGLEAARQIRQVAPNTSMVMFTVHNSEQLLREARANGVRDVVSKCDLLGEHLLTALREACA